MKWLPSPFVRLPFFFPRLKTIYVYYSCHPTGRVALFYKILCWISVQLLRGCLSICYHKNLPASYVQQLYLNSKELQENRFLSSPAIFEQVGMVATRLSCPHRNSVLQTLFRCAPLILSASLPIMFCSLLFTYQFVNWHSHPLLRKEHRAKLTRLFHFQFFLLVSYNIPVVCRVSCYFVSHLANSVFQVRARGFQISRWFL